MSLGDPLAILLLITPRLVVLENLALLGWLKQLCLWNHEYVLSGSGYWLLWLLLGKENLRHTFETSTG